jgi:hypothetical protein
MLRTVADQPTLWEAILPDELRRLPVEFARVDVLLDDPLFFDSDLAVFAFRRCIILNGIDVGALRGDLADRTLPINLDRIEESARLTERHERWTQDQPRIFGDLLSFAARIIKRLPSVRLASSPRMADFARILAAVDQILGTNGLIRFAERARTTAEDTLSAARSSPRWLRPGLTSTANQPICW